jgi:cytochrome c551
MLIVIVLAWVLLGLGVFFVAMRGGPRGARQSLHTESKLSRRSVTLTVVALFAVGAGGVHLNAQEQSGRELFSHTCAVCHTLAATKSVGQIGPNLDIRVGSDISTAAGRKALVLSAIGEGRARGLGQMPALLYQGKEAEDVADFVAAVAGH